jgi:hypothetical protein
MTLAPGRRWAVLAAAGLALLAVVVAWPWLRPALVEPLALAVWLMLRLLVLRLHQAVFWTGLLVVVGLALVKVLRRRLPSPAAAPALPLSGPAHPVEAWREQLARVAEGAPPVRTIGWNAFVELAVALRALELRVPADHRLHDALRDGRSPLPPGVHAFLFGAAPAGPAAGRLRRLRGAPRRWVRRLTGRERADRLHQMSELFSFLEASLELPRHDHHPHDPPARRAARRP